MLRASTASMVHGNKTWMAGTSPAMTSAQFTPIRRAYLSRPPARLVNARCGESTVGIDHRDAHHRVDRRFPRVVLERALGIRIAGLPALVDGFGREVDVAQIVLVFERRGVEPDDVHHGAAAI